MANVCVLYIYVCVCCVCFCGCASTSFSYCWVSLLSIVPPGYGLSMPLLLLLSLRVLSGRIYEPNGPVCNSSFCHVPTHFPWTCPALRLFVCLFVSLIPFMLLKANVCCCCCCSCCCCCCCYRCVCPSRHVIKTGRVGQQEQNKSLKQATNLLCSAASKTFTNAV